MEKTFEPVFKPIGIEVDVEARVGRVSIDGYEHPRHDHVAIPATPFLGDYLLAWLIFSLAATALQWSLERAGLVHSMMMWSTNSILSGSFLIGAGIYQLSLLTKNLFEALPFNG